MPLSSVVGAQSIVRPGVCTSSTRPASPYDGQVIYETDTDRCLVWNSTGWVQLSTGTANAPGLELVKTQTIGTAVSSVEVTSAFSSAYDNYKVVVSGGSSSADTYLKMTLGSTSSGYYWASTYVGYASGGPTRDALANGAFWIPGATTSNGISVTAELFNPNVASATWYTSTVVELRTVGVTYFANGYLANTTQYTSFTLAPNTGTLTGGTIRVYGYRN
jgi:hypothetical protein